MKAAIFGAGRMGTAIAYAMNKMGYSLYIIDKDPAVFASYLNNPDYSHFRVAPTKI